MIKGFTNQNQSEVIINVPAKLIITGEHAISNTGKAIVAVVNKVMSIKVGYSDSFYINDKELTYNDIVARHDGIKRKYGLFLQGGLLIKDVLKEENDLIIACIGAIFERFSNKSDPIKIIINSQIPIGSGMGSSAALCFGLISALNACYELGLSKQQITEMATEIENLKHGKSSGIDVKSISFDGIVCFENGVQSQIKSDIVKNITIINTGQPLYSTGDVVGYVKENFASDNKIWNEFDSIFNKIRQSLQNNDINDFTDGIYENQILLQKLGIVDDTSIKLIEELKENNIHAKVCGAGTIGKSDTSCGIVAVFHELSDDQKGKMCDILNKYGLKSEEVSLHYE